MQNVFLPFYFITGIGAALVQLGINYFEISHLKGLLEVYASNPNIADFRNIVQDYFATRENVEIGNNLLREWSMNPNDSVCIGKSLEQLRIMLEGRMAIPMVGASGAVFGILLAFGMMFPNQRIYVYFLFPIKAKYFVILYMVPLENFSLVFPVHKVGWRILHTLAECCLVLF